MRRLAALIVGAAALGACTSDLAPPVAPPPGSTYAYVQTFRLSERRSGGEELPDTRIEQDVTVTTGSVDDDGAALTIAYGDARVWVGSVDVEPTFTATDAGARDRLYEDAESELSAMYAALFAVMAHSTVETRVDRRGVLHDTQGLDEISRRRDGDAAEDVPGSMLESALSDPSFLLFGRDAAGHHPLRFELAHWKGAIAFDCTLRATGKPFVALEHASGAGDTLTGPLGGLEVALLGTATIGPDDGMLEGMDLSFEISATRNGGEADEAHLVYGLTRKKR